MNQDNTENLNNAENQNNAENVNVGSKVDINAGENSDVKVKVKTKVKIKKPKTPYRGFTRKERLIPSILLSLAIPFTIFFFGPFEAICKNEEMLDFTFMDLLAPSFLISLLVAGLLFGILWNLSGRVFDIVYGILFGAGFLLYLQGNYLNLGLNAVEGDGVGVSSYGTVPMVINLVIWVAVIAAILTAVILIRKKREIMRLVMIVAMVVVVGVQVMMFSLLSFTTDAWTPINQRYTDPSENAGSADASGGYLPSILTNANLTELSSEGNVVWFVVDRFDYNYYKKMAKTDPTFFDNLDGFTLYDNHITKYARTFPSIAYMLTGVENDYSTGRIEYFEKAYGSGTFLKELKENGYNVNVYTEKYYAYHDASVFEGIADNLSSSSEYEVNDRMGLWGDMTRLTLFRYLPFFAKGWVGTINTSDFNGYIEYEANKPLFDSGMKDVYDWMTEKPFTSYEGNKNFTFLHINGCHMPNSYYEDFSMVLDEDDKWDSNLAMKVSFKVVNYYINEMKRLGLYEDATIIITGDHAAAISDSNDLSGSRVTTLLVKKKGESGTPMAVNSAPVEQGQLLASIFESEGIVPKNDYGTSIFEVNEGDDVKRYYHFQKTAKEGGEDVLVVYEVVGDAKVFSNWKKIKEINVGNLYK